MLAWRGEARSYLICLGCSLATDFFDGLLARAWQQETELGAQLDLWGDVGVLLSLPVGMCFLWPEVLRRESWFIAAVVGLYAVSATLAWRKFGQLASYHTWYGKTAQASISVAAFLTLLGWVPWALRAGILIMMLAVLEEIAITLTLRQPVHNIPSWWHARQRSTSN